MWRSRMKDGADPIWGLCLNGCRASAGFSLSLRWDWEGRQRGVAGSSLLRDRVGARLLWRKQLQHTHQNTGIKKVSLAAPTRCNGTFCCTEVNISCGGDLGCKYLGVKTQHQGCWRAGDGKYVSRSTLHRLSLSPQSLFWLNDMMKSIPHYKTSINGPLFFGLVGKFGLIGNQMGFNCTQQRASRIWRRLAPPLRIPDEQWTTCRPGSGREWGDIMERAATSAGLPRHYQ